MSYEKIWREVKDNSATLAACRGPHVFVPIPREVNGSAIPRCRCTICGGTVEALMAMWYDRGIAHGRAHS